MRPVEQQIVQCGIRQAVPTFLQRGHQKDSRDDRNYTAEIFLTVLGVFATQLFSEPCL